MLTDQQLHAFRQNGHVTVASVFPEDVIQSAVADLEAWSQQFLDALPSDQRAWYLEQSAVSEQPRLRKLDAPVYYRHVFREMARAPQLVRIVEQLIGSGVSVFFSQVFCKPPELGGPKPVHQDNFYFGPSDPDSLLTAWIALDDATEENGCLHYVDGSHRGPIYPHLAPQDEPWNLQIPAQQLNSLAGTMTPAPVRSGGVSLHHGNTWHQSSANLSERPRRAVAMHFLQNDARLVQPALEYDPDLVVCISS